VGRPVEPRARRRRRRRHPRRTSRGKDRGGPARPAEITSEAAAAERRRGRRVNAGGTAHQPGGPRSRTVGRVATTVGHPRTSFMTRSGG